MNPNAAPTVAALCPSRFAEHPAQFAVPVPLWMYDRMVDAFAQLVNGVEITDTTRELLPALREHRGAEIPQVWLDGRQLEEAERATELMLVFGTETPGVIEQELTPQVAAGD